MNSRLRKIDDVQKEWHSKTLKYVKAVNDYVEKGRRLGWENAGKEPEDSGSKDLIYMVLDAVREANEKGDFKNFRNNWPPAHEPFVDLLPKIGISIPTIAILPDSSIVARIGTIYELGRVVHINGNHITDISDIKYFGKEPNHRYFAIARENGVQVIDGWNGPEVSFCLWPTGLEGIPEGFNVKPLSEKPRPTQLTPFPDGQRVLLVSCDGIFVLSPSKVNRLLPIKSSLREDLTWSLKEYPNDDLFVGLDMEHAAISRDGRWIAVGSQSSTHLIFNENLELVGNVGNMSEYPHYSIFSEDGKILALNSCHFYSGVTIGLQTNQLPGFKSEPYKEDKNISILEDSSRVYSAVSRKDEFIIGNAEGYIRGFNQSGELRWEHFIGSSIGDMDITPDGKRLVVSTAAGFLSIIDLDVGKPEPYQIGTASHREQRRWIFWRNEPRPLMW